MVNEFEIENRLNYERKEYLRHVIVGFSVFALWTLILFFTRNTHSGYLKFFNLGILPVVLSFAGSFVFKGTSTSLIIDCFIAFIYALIQTLLVTKYNQYFMLAPFTFIVFRIVTLPLIAISHGIWENDNSFVWIARKTFNFIHKIVIFCMLFDAVNLYRFRSVINPLLLKGGIAVDVLFLAILLFLDSLSTDTCENCGKKDHMVSTGQIEILKVENAESKMKIKSDKKIDYIPQKFVIYKEHYRCQLCGAESVSLRREIMTYDKYEDMLYQIERRKFFK